MKLQETPEGQVKLVLWEQARSKKEARISST
jgi:hypothetical protein